MISIKQRRPYSLKNGQHDIKLNVDQKQLILLKEDAEIGEIDLCTKKIALTVSNDELFFEPPLESEDITHQVSTKLTKEIEIGIERFRPSLHKGSKFALFCGLGADDMRSGRMLQTYNLDLHTVNISIRDGYLLIEF